MAAKQEKPSEGVFVKAPLVEVATKGGERRRYLFGDLLGEDVTRESLDHLRNLGFVSDEK